MDENILVEMKTIVPGEIQRTGNLFNQFKEEYGDWAGNKELFRERILDEEYFVYNKNTGTTPEGEPIGSVLDFKNGKVEISLSEGVSNVDIDDTLTVLPVFINITEDYNLLYFSLGE